MKPKFFRKVLKNGMTVIFEKRSLPIVSVAFAVRNGGINEAENEKGISHFIEHMLYKGTTNRSYKQIADEIERNGGELNGSTGENITAYFCKMPSKHINVALDVLSDMVKNPLFEEKELEKERKVIFEEIKMCHDTPRVYVFDKIQNYLYEPPFGKSLLGTYKTMNSINKKKIVEKFEQIYKPNNLVLCVVGDADFGKLCKFAEERFGKEKGKIPKFEIKKKNKISSEKRKGIDQANLIFAYHVPVAGTKESYAAEVLITLMAGGMSSRLFSEIREKRNLAYSIKGASNINKDFAYSMIYVGTTPNAVEKVKKLILEEFSKVSEGLSEKEFKEVKEQIIGNYHISMEDSLAQMLNLLSAEMDGDAKRFYDFEKKIKDVKLKEVLDLAKRAKEKYSFFALIPSK